MKCWLVYMKVFKFLLKKKIYVPNMLANFCLLMRMLIFFFSFG